MIIVRAGVDFPSRHSSFEVEPAQWRDVNWGIRMAQYLISFNDGDMTFPEEDLPEVARAAKAVVQQIKDAGEFVFAGGLPDPGLGCTVSIDGTVTEGRGPGLKDFIGGFTIVDVPNRKAAIDWAAKIAVACRCAQSVRGFLGAPAR